jgi:hypothetical protein
MADTKHTPGPWEWFERQPGRPYLATPDRGQLYVLGFERKGMQGAGPVFSHWPGIEDGAARERKGGIMEPGVRLRGGHMHPDARLIAAAPDMLAALQALRDRLLKCSAHPIETCEAFDSFYQAMVDEAIAKATGEPRA